MASTILQWNIQGIKAKYVAGLSLLLASIDPSVICLQETKLNRKTCDKSPGNSIPGYIAHHHFHQDGEIACGGSSIYIKNNILHRNIKLNTTLQAIACRINFQKPLTICSIYLPPNSNVDSSQLYDLIDQLPTPFYLLGDFNAHNPLWGSDSINPKGRIVEDILFKSNLALLNDGSPTHFDTRSGGRSMIDLTICTPDLSAKSQWSVIDDLHQSDHFPILISQEVPEKQEIPKFFNFKRADWTSFENECLQKINSVNIKDYDNFVDTLNTIVSKNIPKTSPKPRKNKSWFNQECKNSIKTKKTALNKVVHNSTPENFKNFKIARAKSRFIIRQSKRDCFKKYVSKINNTTPISKVFKMIKKFNGTFKEPIQHISKNNTFVETNKEIANEIASTLSKNSSSDNYNENFKKYKKSAEKEKLNFNSKEKENYNSPFTMKELLDSIKDLNDTSPGPDNIHNKIIKKLPHLSLLPLLDIYNDIWENQTFPNAWKEATIIPIPKPGKDHTNPSNYRPIALTSCLCKLLEKLIQKRLQWFLEKNNCLSSLQSGYRKNRSTMDHLVRLEHFIRDAFINGEHISAVFFDLEKAFDTTWKFGIMKDLHNLGLRGNLPLFIQNFLKNRSFHVKVGSELSDPFTQEEGVPQGSILSPLLFEIKINSITKQLKSNINSSLYVDDFLICYKSKARIETIDRQLQQQLNILEKWANTNGFKFSPTKTVAVHFCKKTSCIRKHELNLYNERLPVKDETRFLGVIFDRRLSFIPHIKDLKNRCKPALNALKIFSHPEWGGDAESLLHIYRSLVRSKLDYASPIYSSASNSALKMLDPIQNQGLRLSLGAFKTSPIPSLEAEAYEPPLHLRRTKLAMQYAIKLSSNPDNPAYDCIFKISRTTKLKYDKTPNTAMPLGLRLSNELEELEFTKNSTANFSLPNIPFWEILTPEINLTLTKFRKETTPPETFKKEYRKLVKNYPTHETIFTDGSKSNTAVGLAAVHISRSTEKSLSLRLPSDASISTAETGAISKSLEIANKSNKKKFLILSDSLSCLQSLQQLNPYDIRINSLKERTHNLIENEKEVVLTWIPSHIGIKGNERADTLAKEALTLPNYNPKHQLPFSDFKPKVGALIHSRWVTSWSLEIGNKLHEIKPNLRPRTNLGLSRKDDVIFTRLKIGHTKITHKHLMQKEEQPTCIPCDAPLTVKHILIECVDFAETRKKYYRFKNLKDLFGNSKPSKILGFIREIGLYDKL